MTRPLVLDIADAIVTEINDSDNYTGTLELDGDAVRGWVPRFDLDSLATLQVLVAPTSEASQVLTRKTVMLNETITIWVLKSVQVATMTAEVDALAWLVADIKRTLFGKQMGPGHWVEQRHEGIFNLEALKDSNVFLATPQFVYKVQQAE